MVFAIMVTEQSVSVLSFLPFVSTFMNMCSSLNNLNIDQFTQPIFIKHSHEPDTLPGPGREG